MPRLLRGTVTVEGVDHEDFGSNEHPVDKLREIHLLLDRGPETRLDIAPVKWGGECRVEVNVNALVLNDNRIQIHGDAAFFEGASDDTTEEEDRQTILFFVPRTTTSNPHPHRHHVSLRNRTVIGAEDSADVFFTFTNTILET